MEQTQWESFRLQGGQALEQLKRLLQEGNVRHVRVRQGDRVIADFPLTIGVAAAVLAPVLAAVGAVVALVADCTIDIEHTATDAGDNGNPQAE